MANILKERYSFIFVTGCGKMEVYVRLEVKYGF